MCDLVRHLTRVLLGAVALLGALAWATPARAWLETSIKSDVVTIDVDRSGRALVTHELLMKIRGGPLTSFTLDGIDADAVPQPDATVSIARGGRPTPAVPLLLERGDDGSLRIEIDKKKGLSRGSYLFRFSYRTNFSPERLTQQGALVELRWVGPRLADGVSSVKVSFRVPRASTPPHLPKADGTPDQLGVSEEFDGIFLSQLRREGEFDVLEVVRPHVAKGEPVVWRVLTDARAFKGFSVKEDEGALAGGRVASASGGPESLLLRLGPAALIGFLYALLVALKSHWVALAARLRGATPRALLPLPAAPRAVLAGGLLAGAIAVASLTAQPTIAGLLLVAAMGLAAHTTPLARGRIRGPGSWRQLTGGPSGVGGPTVRLPGRVLDAGSPMGFLLFALALGALVGLSVWLSRTSPYHGMLTLLGSAALLPLFCTGRAGELPSDPVSGPSSLLAFLLRQINKRKGVSAHLLARYPAGQTQPDELRLEVTPTRGVEGLLAIEIGLSQGQPGASPQGTPCVLVRARDASPAYRALPRSVVWTRGRSADERVAVIRPKLPTKRLCLALVLRLVALLTVARKVRRRPPARGIRVAARVPA